MTMETVRIDRAPNGVVTLTLNRPEKKNAMNAVMFDELLAVFREVDAATSDRVLVITGAGDAFCSGADLADRGRDGRHPLARLHWIADIALALHRIPKPIIAKVNGVAVGAGMNLALGCDLIVAPSRRASPRSSRAGDSPWTSVARGSSRDWSGCTGRRSSRSSPTSSPPRTPRRWAWSIAWFRPASSTPS
jgi:1,4-dihydroxy-2-naphthoyl-CoA synthase